MKMLALIWILCFRKERLQFLQVNFTSKVKIVRLSIQGYEDCFVTSLSLFFSDDGVIWKPYKEGSRIKVKGDSKQISVFLRLLELGEFFSSLELYCFEWLCYIFKVNLQCTCHCVYVGHYLRLHRHVLLHSNNLDPLFIINGTYLKN